MGRLDLPDVYRDEDFPEGGVVSTATDGTPTPQEQERLEQGFRHFQVVAEAGAQEAAENPRAAWLVAELKRRFSVDDFATFVVGSADAAINAGKAAYAQGFENGAIAVATGQVQVVFDDEPEAAEGAGPTGPPDDANAAWERTKREGL